MNRTERDTQIWRELEARGQRWHYVPRDDAWRECTLAKSIAENAVMWVECGCGRCEYPTAVELAERTGVDPQIPLLALSMRMRCTACGTKRVEVKHRPYSISWD